ncbi:MAG: sodium:solute symporter family protein [Methanobrevibacter sp.]|uniref:sodium:solute symporter family protein n=1 Tax=Methanobrevibacter sp. TaxID=66852 RepID=UPI0025E49C19|nr:sodium:solute symporter family protein [Methanobrevibacter sp.]MBR0270631.1 sodium:solute symporter family protein [Methanobrevibacter sp.]
MDVMILTIVFIIYIFALVLVGYYAYKKTNSSEDFMIAGKDTHPFIMAMSYGATFISTAAIVGFGGVAGQYGMSVLWLAFLNIIIGIFVAFVFLGKRTRRMGHALGSLTFPEFLGKRFDSKFIHYASGLIIFCAMPLYAAVVLIGAARFLESSLLIDFSIALLILSIIITFYVLFGGIRGVMYTDALQGTIMVVAMVFLLAFVYWLLGGVDTANTALSGMVSLYPAEATATGGTGWTSFPTFGTPFWWSLVSSTLIGVGIGVLAQPSLIVRFMTVKSDKELNRSVLIGGIFIAIMPTTAYIVGSLSNVYFYDKLGQIAVDVVGGNIDKIIPTFITMALPEWFVYIFLLSLIAAAMSTISSQLHTQGTAFGVDIYGTIRDKAKQRLDQVTISRIGILIAIILALIMAFSLPGSVVALGTSLFFEICAAAFLPVFLGALYWKGITRLGAIAGILSGTFVSLFWLIFVFAKTAKGLGICMALLGMETILPAAPWPFIDVMLIAVPISAIFTVVVSLLTKPPASEVIDEAFKNIDNMGDA